MKQRNPAKEIYDFYNNYPFPNIYIKTKKDLKEKGLYKLIYPLTKPYLTKKNLRILDAGCGTGELMLAIEGKNMKIDGIDLSIKSIEIAKKNAKRFRSKVKFKVFDFVSKPLPKNYYDLVYSIGVLHHTENPEQSFKKLVSTVKKGGYITIGIYNPFGEFRFKVKRGIVHFLAGNNYQKRIKIGQKFFFRKKRVLTAEDWVGIADAYANPYRKYYTFDQLLNWFKKNDIEFINCLPPIGIFQNINFALQIFSNLLQGKGPSLIQAWDKAAENSIHVNNWELNPILTFLVQFAWLIMGRGTIINIIGRVK